MAFTPTQDDVSIAAVAGSVLTSRERERLVHSNKKLSNILGGAFQSSLLPLLDRTNFDACLSSNVTHRVRACSPFSDSSTDTMSILHIRRRSSCSFFSSTTNASEKTLSQTPSVMSSANRKSLPPVTFAPPSPSLQIAIPPLEDGSKKTDVPPLKLKSRMRRKSLSIAGVEMNLSERNALRLSTAEPEKASTASSSRLTRSQTVSTVGRHRTDDLSRPLPQVPPPSRSSSFSSSGHSSPHNSRPLPSRPSPSPSRVLQKPQPKLHIVNVSSRPNTPPPSKYLLSPIPDESQLSSPMMIDVDSEMLPSFSSSTTILPRSLQSTPRSTLKHSRPTSISSVSTLALFPPPPTSSEERKRKMDKLAKLTRILGDTPPAELVFGKDKEPGHSRRSSMDRSGVSDKLYRQSSSLTRRAATDRSGESERWREKEREREKERFTIDDDESECMHSEAHAHVYRPSDIRAFPVPRGTSKPSESKESALMSIPSRLRLRSRNKEPDVPMRRVVSLNVDANTPFITFTQSHKTETHPRTADKHKVPRHTPATLPLSLDKEKHGNSRWLEEVGEDRWEVESYGKVVRTLRELL